MKKVSFGYFNSQRSKMINTRYCITRRILSWFTTWSCLEQWTHCACFQSFYIFILVLWLRKTMYRSKSYLYWKECVLCHLCSSLYRVFSASFWFSVCSIIYWKISRCISSFVCLSFNCFHQNLSHILKFWYKYICSKDCYAFYLTYFQTLA